MNLPENRNQSDPGDISRLETISRLIRLIRKEVKEILQDRRTILTLVFMPILLYPLLSIVFQQLLVAGASEKAKETEVIRVAFPDRKQAETFFQFVVSEHNLRMHEKMAGRKPTSLPSLPPIEDPFYFPKSQIAELLRNHAIDLAVILTTERIPRTNQVMEWEILYFEGSLRSAKAARQVQKRLAALNTGYLRAFVNLRGLPPFIATNQKATAIEAKKVDAFPIAAVVPLILTLMTITGAVYPAIDLTAGERERGTLEILVAAPVPRLGLLFAKYVSVLTVAVLTALVNLVMMALTVWLSPFGQSLLGGGGLTLLRAVQIFGLLLLFAGFYSAILLAMTSFARSFKEAQAYLIPLMLVSLAPGLAAMMPGLQLSPSLCMVPLLNVVLLGRDVLNSSAQPLHAVLVVLSTVIYAAGAIALASRVFGAEDVLYNEQTSWKDMLRRPSKPLPAPSLGGALICLCLIFFSTFVVFEVSAKSITSAMPTAAQLQYQVALFAAASVLFYTGLPFLAAVLRRVSIRRGFRLHTASVSGFAAAVLLGVALWPFVLQLVAWQQQMGWTTLSDAQQRGAASAMERLREAVPLGWLIGTAVLTGLAEEVFFRGFLLKALLNVSRARVAIITAALLFAVAHVLVKGGVGIERFLPSFGMGLVLGWVSWRCGSVLPAMALHGLYNGMLIGANSYFSTLSQNEDWWLQFPLWVFALAGVGVVVGSLLVFWQPKSLQK